MALRRFGLNLVRYRLGMLPDSQVTRNNPTYSESVLVLSTTTPVSSMNFIVLAPDYTDLLLCCTWKFPDIYSTPI